MGDVYPRAAVAGLLLLVLPASAAWNPPDVDLTRPRILLRSGDVPLIQARLQREPYETLLAPLLNRARSADGIALDDHSIASERIKARAAKNLAFLYAIDRTRMGGHAVPFSTPEERVAVGDRVRDLADPT